MCESSYNCRVVNVESTKIGTPPLSSAQSFLGKLGDSRRPFRGQWRTLKKIIYQYAGLAALIKVTPIGRDEENVQ